MTTHFQHFVKSYSTLICISMWGFFFQPVHSYLSHIITQLVTKAPLPKNATTSSSKLLSKTYSIQIHSQRSRLYKLHACCRLSSTVSFLLSQALPPATRHFRVPRRLLNKSAFVAISFLKCDMLSPPLI